MSIVYFEIKKKGEKKIKNNQRIFVKNKEGLEIQLTDKKNNN